MASASIELAGRVDELARNVLAPLVLGGRIVPVRPFGAKLSFLVAQAEPAIDAELRSRLDVARVRVARRLAPVDVLPDLDGPTLALVAAYSDLLQATNHELGGAFRRARHVRLVDAVRELCEHVAAPRDLLGTLARHATLARALEAARTDTRVSWWTGHADFRGQAPSARLMMWPELRRVQVSEQKVAFVEMPSGLGALPADAFLDAVALWLGRSPLTDVATLTRSQPAFAWSASTLSLIANQAGRDLAWRILGQQPKRKVLDALARANTGLAGDALADARFVAESFVAEVTTGFEQIAAPA